MLQNLIQIVKRNFSVILFSVFIVFIVVSFLYTGSQTNENARKLLVFATNSVEDVDKSLIDLADKSGKYEANDQSFDDFINQISSLSFKLQNYSNSIPNKNTDQASLDLQKNLYKFFNTLKVEIVDKFLEKTKERKSLSKDYEKYGALKTLVFTSTVKDIKNSLESGEKILNFEKKYLFLISDLKIRTNREKDNESDLQKNTKLHEFLNNKADGETLNDSDIENATKIYDNFWPLELPSFPKIEVNNLKTKFFNDNIESLQNNLTMVASKFSIEQ